MRKKKIPGFVNIDIEAGVDRSVTVDVKKHKNYLFFFMSNCNHSYLKNLKLGCKFYSDHYAINSGETILYGKAN